jgi:FlaA1/EpsC-like NDP-sugar epimerase
MLVVGAGRLGRSFAREVRETPGQRIVGFLDDNPSLRGRRIAGQRVLGSLGDVERAITLTGATEVMVTIADAPKERLELLGTGCAKAGVTCTVMRRRVETVLESAGATAE